jgi:hypothetical protein
MAKESFIPTDSGEGTPWVIPFLGLAYYPEEKAYRVRKSELRPGFHFYQLTTAWSDIAVLLRNANNKFGIFYLATTKEEESRVVSWQFKLIPYQEPFFPEWQNVTLIISND